MPKGDLFVMGPHTPTLVAQAEAVPIGQRIGKHVIFYGASDDLIEVEGNVPGCDEYTADGSDQANFECAGLRVGVFYTKDGVWGVSVGQIDEDVPVLAQVEALYARGYTMVLELAVPEGAHVTRLP